MIHVDDDANGDFQRAGVQGVDNKIDAGTIELSSP
jgi:hypothetical protein